MQANEIKKKHLTVRITGLVFLKAFCVPGILLKLSPDM